MRRATGYRCRRTHSKDNDIGSIYAANRAEAQVRLVGERKQDAQGIEGATDDSPATEPKHPKTLCSAQQAAALVKLRTLFSDISGLSADQLVASAPFLEIGLDSLAVDAGLHRH